MYVRLQCLISRASEIGLAGSDYSCRNFCRWCIRPDSAGLVITSWHSHVRGNGFRALENEAFLEFLTVKTFFKDRCYTFAGTSKVIVKPAASGA